MKQRSLTIIFLMLLHLAGTAAGGTGNLKNAAAESSIGCQVTLAPFYLIQEKAGKVWIERVFVTIEGAGVSVGVDQPGLRSLLFEALASEPEEGASLDRIKSVLEPFLGRSAVMAVHLNRCFLLF